MVALLAVGAAVAAAAVASSSSRDERAPSRVVAELPLLDRFDLSREGAVQAQLPLGLREISGLAVAPDGRVLAHADERGVVSQIHICDGTVEKSFSLGSPPVRDDFEGIAIADGRLFLITSAGRLYESREGANGAIVPYTALETGFGSSCEIEGLTWDPVSRTLVTGCKQALVAGRPGQITFLRWSVDGRAPATPPSLTLTVTGPTTRRFRPSAVEYNMGSRKLHRGCWSGALDAGVHCHGRGGRITTTNRQLHRQPEGLALLGDSLLVIADEGAGKRGTLTCYRAKR
jgi:hypothetical protein